MTREEAIKEIIRAYDVLDFSCHMDNRRKEAFNMAKVALEQEPVYFPPCVDCNTKMNEIREAYDKLKKQDPSEWQQDHAILKAHSDGANEVIDRIKEAREEISNYNVNAHYLSASDSFRLGVACGLDTAEAILDKLIAEVEGTE